MDADTPKDGPTPAGWRADIDGLRAVAVLLVAVFHAFPALLPGGYLGVDVFFVISGYLITGLLLRDARDGRFSIGRFYARRVRRLFPALTLVTAACLAFGWFALLPEEYARLGRHVLASSLFVPNLAFWSEAGYWDTASATKPLLHLWSLGVEEQFYLVWPALLLLGHRAGVPLAAWAAPLAALSFVAALLAGEHDGVATAFFLPMFRLWELAAGGLVAAWQRVPRRSRPGDGATARASRRGADVAVLGGLVVILASAFVFAGDAGHSAWSALPPVLGTALVLASGGAGGASSRALSSRPMVLVGKASYPFYLWHWPMLSFVVIVEGEAAPAPWRLAILAAALLLALATWRFVEAPVRSRRGARGVALLVALSLGIGAAGGIVERSGGFPHRTAHLAAQLDAFEWESKGLFSRDDCFGRIAAPTRCFSSGEPHRVAVVGDSYSTNTFFVLQEHHRGDGAGVLRLGKAGCLPFQDVERTLAGVNQGCRDAMNRSLDHVLSDPGIGTVVLSLRSSLYLGTEGGNRLFLGDDTRVRHPDDVFREALDRTVERLQDAGRTVVYALDWPELDFDPRQCVDVRPLRFSRFRARPCEVAREKVDALDGRARAIVMETLARHPGALVWDPKQILCDQERCRAMLDGVVLYRDSHHLSLAGSEYLGRRFATAPPSPPRSGAGDRRTSP